MTNQVDQGRDHFKVKCVISLRLGHPSKLQLSAHIPRVLLEWILFSEIKFLLEVKIFYSVSDDHLYKSPLSSFLLEIRSFGNYLLKMFRSH